MSNKGRFILITETTQDRVESRYKNCYKLRGVAQRHADKMNARRYEDFVRFGGRTAPEKIIVVSEEDYAVLIAGQGEWRHNLMSGAKMWVAKDTPACCDPSTESYWSM